MSSDHYMSDEDRDPKRINAEDIVLQHDSDLERELDLDIERMEALQKSENPAGNSSNNGENAVKAQRTFKIPKKTNPERMFRPFNIKAARTSVHLNKKESLPPREQLDNANRQKISDNILHQICAAHPTNKIPKEFADQLRQTFSDLEVSKDFEWLEETIGESRWLFMHGLYNKKHAKPSKLVLGTIGRRAAVLDLRTLSSSGGLPDVIRLKTATC